MFPVTMTPACSLGSKYAGRTASSVPRADTWALGSTHLRCANLGEAGNRTTPLTDLDLMALLCPADAPDKSPQRLAARPQSKPVVGPGGYAFHNASAPSTETSPGRLRLAEISSYGAADLRHFVVNRRRSRHIANTDGAPIRWSGYAADINYHNYVGKSKPRTENGSMRRMNTSFASNINYHYDLIYLAKNRERSNITITTPNIASIMFPPLWLLCRRLADTSLRPLSPLQLHF